MNGEQPSSEMERDVSASDSDLSRLAGIFRDPSVTFDRVDRRPNWLLPMLGVILVSLLTNTFFISTIGYDRLISASLEQNMETVEMSPEELEALMASTQTINRIAKVTMYVAPIFSFITIVVVAGVLLLALTVMGSPSTYRKVLSVTGHSYFAQTLVNSGALCLLTYLNPEGVVSDINNPIKSNLGFLVDSKQSPLLHTLASALDLFSFYCMYLLSKGLPAVSKGLTYAAGLTAILLLWVIWVGLRAVFSLLF